MSVEVNNVANETGDNMSALDKFLEFLRKFGNLMKQIEEALGMNKSKTQLSILKELNETMNQIKENMEEMCDNNKAFQSIMGNDMCEEIAKKCEELTVTIEGIDLDDEKSCKDCLKQLLEFNRDLHNIELIGAKLDDLQAEHPLEKLKIYKYGDMYALGYTKADGNKEFLVAYNGDFDEIPVEKAKEHFKDFEELVPNFDSYAFIKELLEKGADVTVTKVVDIEKYASTYSEALKGTGIDVESIEKEDGSFDLVFKKDDASLVMNVAKEEGRINTGTYIENGEKTEVYGKTGEDIQIVASHNEKFAYLMAYSPLGTTLGEFADDLKEDLHQEEVVQPCGKEQSKEEKDLTNGRLETYLLALSVDGHDFEKTVTSPEYSNYICKIKVDNEKDSIYIYGRDVMTVKDSEVFRLGDREFVAVKNGKDVTDEILSYTKEFEERVKKNPELENEVNKRKSKGEER